MNATSLQSSSQNQSQNHRRRSSGGVVQLREDRKVLFRNAAQSPSINRRGGTTKNSSSSTTTTNSTTAHEAHSIAQSLQRTQNLLKNELHRVSQVSVAIDEDGKMLEDTKQTHQSLNVAGAKKALTSLQRAQQHEQRVLMASVFFFVTVVVYILWQRILIKLPFVERLWNVVLKQSRDQILFGRWSFLDSSAVKNLFHLGVTKVRQVLDLAKVHGEQMWDTIRQKIGEVYQKVQGINS